MKLIPPYIATWVEVRAQTGFIRLSDFDTLGFYRFWGKEQGYPRHRKTAEYKFFENKSAAIEWIKERHHIGLKKQYECRLFTDKQMSMACSSKECWKGTHFIIPFTTKQNEEVYYIG